MKILLSTFFIASLLAASDQPIQRPKNESKLANAIYNLKKNKKNMDLFVLLGLEAYTQCNYLEAEKYFTLSAINNSTIGAQLKACCLHDQGNTRAALVWERRAENSSLMR